jgi:hypothetical protein
MPARGWIRRRDSIKDYWRRKKPPPAMSIKLDYCLRWRIPTAWR